MIVSAYEIPLSASNQQFHINLGGIDYTFTIRWNYRGTIWMLNIGNAIEQPLINGIPLVININLLLGFQSFRIGGIGTNLFVRSVIKPGAFFPENPGFADLGINSRMYFSINQPDTADSIQPQQEAANSGIPVTSGFSLI